MLAARPIGIIRNIRDKRIRLGTEVHFGRRYGLTPITNKILLCCRIVNLKPHRLRIIALRDGCCHRRGIAGGQIRGSSR